MTGPLGMVTGRVRRVQDSARQTRAAITKPKPPVEVDTARTLPAWVLRLVGLLAGVTILITLGASAVPTVLLSALLLVVTVRQSPATGAAFCAGIGFFWMILPTPDLGAAQFVLLALAHLSWTLAGTLTGLPLRARIEIAALVPTAVRFVIIDVISQLLLVGAQLLRAGVTGTSTANTTAIGAVVLACAVLVAIAAWLVLPRLNRI